MRNSLLGAFLVAVVIVVGLNFVGLGALGICDADEEGMVHWGMGWIEHNRRAQDEITTIGISPSSDAAVLFEEFAKRFSLKATLASGKGPRDIRSIAEAGGGDRYELVFVLLHLFMWNKFDVDEVRIYSAQRVEPGGSIEHLLVYVRSIDRYFDPTLPLSEQPNGSHRALLAGRPRTYLAPSGGRPAPGCTGSQRNFYSSRWAAFIRHVLNM